LGGIWQFWGDWIALVGALQDLVPSPRESPITVTAMDVTDYLQASVVNVLAGFYRLAFTSLRAVLEGMTIGLDLELSRDQRAFNEWMGGEEIRFGGAADRCTAHAPVAALEASLRTAVGDELFRQARGSAPSGLVRRLFSEVSRYAHGLPGYRDI